MTNTTYYNLTKAEGSDTVNLLTQNYPNFDIIDTAMHNNAIDTVTTAVETKVGTVHQVVRTNSECAMFRFVATSNWVAGDSFTVDGVAVSTVTVDGQALQSGAFIINANVLCCVVGGLMTVYVGGGSAIAEDSNKLGGQLPSYYAKQTDMAAVKGDITSLNSNLTTLSTRVDGLETKTDISSQYSVTSVTTGNINSITAYKIGSLVELWIDCGTVQTTIGKNATLGTISGPYLPRKNVSHAVASGDACMISNLTDNGTFLNRVIVNTIYTQTSGFTVHFVFTV